VVLEHHSHDLQGDQYELDYDDCHVNGFFHRQPPFSVRFDLTGSGVLTLWRSRRSGVLTPLSFFPLPIYPNAPAQRPASGTLTPVVGQKSKGGEW
jgi:hypothetical protein